MLDLFLIAILIEVMLIFQLIALHQYLSLKKMMHSRDIRKIIFAREAGNLN